MKNKINRIHKDNETIFKAANETLRNKRKKINKM